MNYLFSQPRSNAVARFLLIVLVVHAPSWLTAWVFQVPRTEERPLFNLDLLVAASIACVSSLAGVICLVIAWAADATRAAATNYHFMSTLDFVDAARFLDMIDMRPFMSRSLLLVAVGWAACLWLILQQTRNARQMVLPLWCSIVFIAGIDVANGSFHPLGLGKDSRIVNFNFAGSPSWNIWEEERRALQAPGVFSMEVPGAYQALHQWQDTHPGRSSVLILVESLGLPRAPALRAWLLKQLATSRVMDRWSIQESDEAFVGTTTSGELRVLCGLRGHYSRLSDVQTQACLPHLLAPKGVTSVGFHGFGLRMFDRSHWWPRVGLQPWVWPEHGKRQLPMNCNLAFPGVCDNAVIEQALKQAQLSNRFIYALTLDTHLPLNANDATPVPDELVRACAASSTPREACQLIRNLGEVFKSLESQLADSATTPLVVVVGDHAPPFGERGNREAFVEDRVPLMILAPKAAR